MNSQYIVDVTYNSGEVALYGPFPQIAIKDTDELAIDFVERIKKAGGSCVVEARIRVLNKI
jgi:hypothetical protein